MPNKHRNKGAIWSKTRQHVIDQSNTCALCGQPLVHNAPSGHPLSTEIDHIIPISQGGPQLDLGNLRALHQRCHRTRNSLTRSALRTATRQWTTAHLD